MSQPTDPVHITRLSQGRRRVYIADGYQVRRRQITTDKGEAQVFTRERAELILAGGRFDRYKPAIEEAGP